MRAKVSNICCHSMAFQLSNHGTLLLEFNGAVRPLWGCEGSRTSFDRWLGPTATLCDTL